MPTSTTNIHRRVMRFAHLMSTSLNIMSSARLMTQTLCDNLAVRF
jgi:hypothetical protein